MNHSPELNKKLFAMLKQLGLVESRADVVFNFTGGRTSSVKEMSGEEVIGLTNALEKNTKITDREFAMFDKHNHRHLYILSLAMQLGWTCVDHRSGSTVADLNILGKWIRSDKCAVRIPLRNMTAAQYSKVIYQLEQILLKSLNNEKKR